MVQFLLKPVKALAMASILLLCQPAAFGRKDKPREVTVPEILLDARGSNQRKLTFERVFSNEREVKMKRGFWNKVVDIIAGEPNYKFLVRPYSVVTDSHNRVIVTDPGVKGIHIFDFEKQKYKFIARTKETDALEAPQCVAVDAADNIYVTDSKAGKIFIFDASGKFRREIGSLRGGEGFFKRPTGIAVDSKAERIYVTDTLRNKIFVMDMHGAVLQSFGMSGTGEGEFNYPTELRLHGDELYVVDAMNFRVQILDRMTGQFHNAFGHIGENRGEFYRTKGLGIDSEDHIYVLEALSDTAQVFTRQGVLLYYFGHKGTGLAEFQLPTDLFIDRNDRIYIVDSYNRRIQVFHYAGEGKQVEGAKH